MIEGNDIGTDITGTQALGNVTNGVEILGATNCTIGGTTAAARNVISGNGQTGIHIVSVVNLFGVTGPSSATSSRAITSALIPRARPRWPTPPAC